MSNLACNGALHYFQLHTTQNFWQELTVVRYIEPFWQIEYEIHRGVNCNSHQHDGFVFEYYFFWQDTILTGYGFDHAPSSPLFGFVKLFCGRIFLNKNHITYKSISFTCSSIILYEYKNAYIFSNFLRKQNGGKSSASVIRPKRVLRHCLQCVWIYGKL